MKNRIYSVIDDQNLLSHTMKYGGHSDQVGQVIYTLAGFDRIVYCPNGLVNTVSGLTGIPKRTTRKAIESLCEQGLFEKEDEFSGKVAKHIRTRATNSKEIYVSEEMDDFIKAVDNTRIDSWELRGKHTRGKPMKNNREMLKHLVVTIDDIYEQMITKADLKIVIAMIAALSPEDQAKLRHLKLV